MNRGTEQTRRLFFALWPDDTIRGQLAAAAHRWARRPIADASLHMTLVFLGSRTAEEHRCFSEAVSGLRSDSFELQLDYLGAWPRRHILWLGTTHIPGPLVELVRQFNQVLPPCGYEVEKRPFVPHITLSRKEKNPQPKTGVESIRWPVTEFVLVESVAVPDGVRYQPIERWPLRKTG